jgi:hypothetical protein
MVTMTVPTAIVLGYRFGTLRREWPEPADVELTAYH